MHYNQTRNEDFAALLADFKELVAMVDANASFADFLKDMNMNIDDIRRCFADVKHELVPDFMFDDLVRKDHMEQPHISIILYVYVTLITVSIILNGLLIALSRQQRLQVFISHAFLLQLACNILHSGLLSPLNLIREFVVDNLIVCRCASFIQNFVMTNSAMTFLFLAGERYVAATRTHPMSETTRRRTSIVVVTVICIVSTLVSIPRVIWVDWYALDRFNESGCMETSHAFCKYDPQGITYGQTIIIESSLFFFIPGLLIAIAYSRIGYIIWRRSRGTVTTGCQVKRQILTTLVIVTVSFYLFWSPNILFQLITHDNDASSSVIPIYLRAITIGNTITNALIVLRRFRANASAQKSQPECNTPRVQMSPAVSIQSRLTEIVSMKTVSGSQNEPERSTL